MHFRTENRKDMNKGILFLRQILIRIALFLPCICVIGAGIISIVPLGHSGLRDEIEWISIMVLHIIVTTTVYYRKYHTKNDQKKNNTNSTLSVTLERTR